MNTHLPIPTGLRLLAQGWSEPDGRGATLGHEIKMIINPNGVVSVRDGRPQPRWGWVHLQTCSQGSADGQSGSDRATLGFGPESLWDSPFNQRGGLGKAHQLFGEQLPKLLDELNEVLAA